MDSSYPHGLPTVQTVEHDRGSGISAIVFIKNGVKGRLKPPFSCSRSEDLSQAQGGLLPWAVFVVIGLRNREDAKHLRCFEESFRFFCIEKMQSIFAASKNPSGSSPSSRSLRTVQTPPLGRQPHISGVGWRMPQVIRPAAGEGRRPSPERDSST